MIMMIFTGAFLIIASTHKLSLLTHELVFLDAEAITSAHEVDLHGHLANMLQLLQAVLSANLTNSTPG